MLDHKIAVRRKLFQLGRNCAVLLPLMLIALLMTQVAFAKTTYRINDSGNITLHATFTTDPEEILDEAGVELGEDDTFITQDGIGVSHIHVQRKQEVTVICGDHTWTVTSYGETVQELLTRMGLRLDEDDTSSVSLDSETFDGLHIVLNTTATAQETYSVTVAYETEFRYDPTLAKGEQVVLTYGVPGMLECVDQISYVNGKQIERTLVSQELISEPVTEVIAIGTKLHNPIVGEGDQEKHTQGKLKIENGVIITPEGKALTYTKTMQVVATAYHNTDPGCTIYTSTGTLCRVGAIAVDPRIIPYGTKMYIITNDGQYIYGEAVAEDCGSAIKGNRVDLYYDTVAECWQFGIREATIYFLN